MRALGVGCVGDADDIARHGEAEDLRPGKRRAELGLVGRCGGGDPTEHLGGDEFSEHRRGLLVADGSPHERQKWGDGTRVVMEGEERLDDSCPSPFGAFREEGGDKLTASERNLHGGDEQALLGAEEAMHESWVDVRVPSHGANANRVIAPRGER